MRTYIFPIAISLSLLLLITADYVFNLGGVTPEESTIIVAFATIPFTMNYALMVKFERNNLFKDYKSLALLPFTPFNLFFKELLFIIKKPQILILLVSIYLLLLYFHWDSTIYTILLFLAATFFYVVFILFCLLVIRFLCGHNAKGSTNFYIICMLIGAAALLQIALAEKSDSHVLIKSYLETNPLNSLFLLPVIRNQQPIISILYYLVFMVVALPLLRNTTWERALTHISQ